MDSPSLDSVEHRRPTWRTRAKHWWAANGVFIKLAVLAFLIVLVYLSTRILVFVESGQAGVLYRRLGGGTQTNRVYGEGLHFIAPWNTMTIYNERYQQLTNEFSIISSNGLSISITLSIRYRPRESLLGILHKQVGPNYANVIIIPEIQSLVRRVLGHYSPQDIYSTKLSMLQNILEGSMSQIAERYLTLDDVLIKNIQLPPEVEAAIERKLIEKQRYLAMQYRIQRASQEADYRRIEAKGVQIYQDTISQTLTTPVLDYEGIKAAREIARSPNPKVVVIGANNHMFLGLTPNFTSGTHQTASFPTNLTWSSLSNRLSINSNVPPASAGLLPDESTWP